jgi:preprotein translocase subunit SecE
MKYDDRDTLIVIAWVIAASGFILLLLWVSGNVTR